MCTDQKSGLKLSILNLLKLTGDQLVGYFPVELQYNRSKKVVEFLKVLKLFENDYFGDAYYDLKYRRNRTLRKPMNLPKDEDVTLLLNECKTVIESIDEYDYPTNSFANIRSALVIILIIFSARRGGESVRLQMYQWDETKNGNWIDKCTNVTRPKMVTGLIKKICLKTSTNPVC